jgi:hypothetical protein
MHRIDLARLELPTVDLQEIASPFMEEEITRAVLDSPPDRAPGLDGFTGSSRRTSAPSSSLSGTKIGGASTSSMALT